MSYRFVVPRGGPDKALLSAAGAQWTPFTAQGDHGVIAWRGRSSRGVGVFEEEGNAHFRINTMASPDDVSLAMELAIRHALARNVPIDAEDVPHGHYHESKAPEAPPGFQGIYLVRAEELQAWPADWYEPHATSAAPLLARIVRDGGAVCLSGPQRRTLVGVRWFLQCFAREGVSMQAGMAQLIELLADAQDVRDARLPLMPRWLGGSPVGAQGLFSKLLGKHKLPVPARAMWSPSPFACLGPTHPYGGDIISLPPDKRREGNHTVAIKGATYLLPLSDYVALRETHSEWMCVPFGTFMEALGTAFRWLDEYTAVISAPDGEQWNALLARLTPAAIARIPHQDDFLKTAQDLYTEATT
jgi:hypothetical protein